jgi:hypothetical protein
MNTLDLNLKSQAIEARVLNVLIYLDMDWADIKEKYKLSKIVNNFREFSTHLKGMKGFVSNILRNGLKLF